MRALRAHLGFTQEQLAQEMGTRQQTISEWETGMYQPRGVSERYLHVLAESSDFVYGAEQGPEAGDQGPEAGVRG